MKAYAQAHVDDLKNRRINHPVSVVMLSEVNKVEKMTLFQTPHPKVYGIICLLYLWVLGCFAGVFWQSPTAIFMVAISSAFFAMYVGTPFVLHRIAKHKIKDDHRLSDFLAGEMDTFTGRCSGWAALVQITVVPAAVAITVSCISLIIAFHQ